MAKKAKKNVTKKVVRTREQRSAAAKKAWRARRTKESAALAHPEPEPELVVLPEVQAHRTPLPAVAFPPQSDEDTDLSYLRTVSACAVQEGSEMYVVIGIDGSLYRHNLPRSLIRKLGLECITLAG